MTFWRIVAVVVLLAVGVALYGAALLAVAPAPRPSTPSALFAPFITATSALSLDAATSASLAEPRDLARSPRCRPLLDATRPLLDRAISLTHGPALPVLPELPSDEVASRLVGLLIARGLVESESGAAGRAVTSWIAAARAVRAIRRGGSEGPTFEALRLAVSLERRVLAALSEGMDGAVIVLERTLPVLNDLARRARETPPVARVVEAQRRAVGRVLDRFADDGRWPEGTRGARWLSLWIPHHEVGGRRRAAAWLSREVETFYAAQLSAFESGRPIPAERAVLHDPGTWALAIGEAGLSESAFGLFLSGVGQDLALRTLMASLVPSLPDLLVALHAADGDARALEHRCLDLVGAHR